MRFVLVGAKGPRLLQQAIDERRLAVIDVSYDGDIANMFHDSVSKSSRVVSPQSGKGQEGETWKTGGPRIVRRLSRADRFRGRATRVRIPNGVSPWAQKPPARALLPRW